MTTVSHHKLKDEEVEAIIFDVDGTLIDSMPLFFKSWNRVCAYQGCGLSFNERQFYTTAGVPLREIVTNLYSSQKGKEPTAEWLADFRTTMKKVFKEVVDEQGHPAAIECVVSIAKEMKSRGLKLAAASSGLRQTVLRHLKQTGLLELFDEDHIVVAGDLPPGRGKPHPDIFLEAAKRLGVDPSKCRAFEDGESGLQAAFKAGMEVIDVRELDGYPISDTLKETLPHFKASRTWLKS